MGSRDWKIVLLGKTGAGKSSAGNTIFGGEEVFHTESSPSSTAQRCQSETRTVGGREITLIDPPGFFDTEITDEDELRSKIVRCVTECAPGPHAFIIVLEVGVYDEQEKQVIDMFQQYFSPEAFKYATVLFTHGDQLDEDQTIEEFVAESDDLNALVQRCGNRFHVVDNEFWNDRPDGLRSNRTQVDQLLRTVDRMALLNRGGRYGNAAL